jgi:hypothetical protein
VPSTGMLHQTAIRRNCHPLKAFNRKDRGVKTLRTLRKLRKRFALCSLRFSSRTLRLKALRWGSHSKKRSGMNGAPLLCENCSVTVRLIGTSPRKKLHPTCRLR